MELAEHSSDRAEMKEGKQADGDDDSGPITSLPASPRRDRQY
jgi:hypothetical protein